MVEQIMELGRLLAGLMFFMALNILSGSGKANLLQEFNKEILMNGIKKAVYILLSVVLLCGAGLCLPEFELALSADGEPLTIFAALQGTLFAMNGAYGATALKNFIAVFGVKTSITQVTGHELLPEYTELVNDDDVVIADAESVG